MIDVVILQLTCNARREYAVSVWQGNKVVHLPVKDPTDGFTLIDQMKRLIIVGGIQVVNPLTF